MTTEKKHICFHVLPVVISVLSITWQSAYTQQFIKYDHRVFNFGLRAGLNATSISHYKVYVEGEELENGLHQNKTGLAAALFMRINLKYLFLQPEIGISKNNRDLTFLLPTGDGGHISTVLSAKTNTAKVNVLLGYNLIKNGPFLFNIIAGTSLGYNYKTWYSSSLIESQFSEDTPYYNTNGIVGFTINITKVYFDIRYEMSLLSTNTKFDKIPNKLQSFNGMVINKNENILSFSCGVMF
jgi:hypothetical protein